MVTLESFSQFDPGRGDSVPVKLELGFRGHWPRGIGWARLAFGEWVFSWPFHGFTWFVLSL